MEIESARLFSDDNVLLLRLRIPIKQPRCGNSYSAVVRSQVCGAHNVALRSKALSDGRFDFDSFSHILQFTTEQQQQVI